MHFEISRPTLSRRIASLGDAVVIIGKTSSTTYAARDDNASELPLYAINEAGKPAHLGTLIPLARGEWFLQSNDKIATLFHAEFKDGLYPGWPWFLADLRPSGFLGRAFARQLAQSLSFDDHPENWSDGNVAQAISMFGTNLQGNLVVGERALDKLLNHGHTRIIRSAENDFSELANCALQSGAEFGSSAGGEQPKFTSYVENRLGPRHVIVKFSPPIDQPTGRRWADLLIAEHIANQVLSANGIACAQTHIHEIDGRIFLESERFDRIGPTGRRGLVSLRALDAAFVGQGSGSWIKCAQRLTTAKLITAEDRERITQLWCFGNLIANTDRHFGNLSFYLEKAFPAKLAPCYDMLPMLFRPAASGEIPHVEFQPKRPLPEHEATWQQILPLALEFWHQLSNESRISKAFQVIAGRNEEALQELKVLEASESSPKTSPFFKSAKTTKAKATSTF